jgi:hypothetical protein
MPGGGSRPGERRGGRPKGSKDKKVIERETIAAEIRAGRIAAGIAMPLMATEKLEMLLSIALRHMEESHAAENVEEYAAWYERATVMARSLTPYQTPQLRAIAVAHTGISLRR